MQRTSVKSPSARSCKSGSKYESSRCPPRTAFRRAHSHAHSHYQSASAHDSSCTEDSPKSHSGSTPPADNMPRSRQTPTCPRCRWCASRERVPAADSTCCSPRTRRQRRACATRDGERDVMQREGRLLVRFVWVLLFVFVLLLLLPAFLLVLPLRLLLPHPPRPIAHTTASCSGSTTNGAPSRSGARKTSERRTRASRASAIAERVRGTNIVGWRRSCWGC